MKPLPSPPRTALRCALLAVLQLLAFAQLALVACSPALAGHITLQISTTRAVQDRQLQCQVNVVNQGDESAANVQVHLEFQGRRYSSPAQPTLGVQQNRAASFSLPITGLPSGRHSLAVIVDYTDTNGYPFTALSYADFIVGEDNPPKIHGVIEALELDRDGELQLRVKNLDATPRQLKLRLVLPKEISSPQAENQIALSGSGEQTLRFRVRNFSALAGSSYQVFVLVEYDEQGKHSSVFMPGTIKIVAARNFLETYRVALTAGIGLLILLFVGLQLYPRFRK